MEFRRVLFRSRADFHSIGVEAAVRGLPFGKDRAIGSLFLRLLLKAQWLLLHRQSQDRGALEQGQLRGVARGFLRHLATACPGSDNCHPLSGERKSALRQRSEDGAERTGGG